MGNEPSQSGTACLTLENSWTHTVDGRAAWMRGSLQPHTRTVKQKEISTNSHCGGLAARNGKLKHWWYKIIQLPSDYENACLATESFSLPALRNNNTSTTWQIQYLIQIYLLWGMFSARRANSPEFSVPARKLLHTHLRTTFEGKHGINLRVTRKKLRCLQVPRRMGALQRSMEKYQFLN